jgi:hypothetical protein
MVSLGFEPQIHADDTDQTKSRLSDLFHLRESAANSQTVNDEKSSLKQRCATKPH